MEWNYSASRGKILVLAVMYNVYMCVGYLSHFGEPVELVAVFLTVLVVVTGHVTLHTAASKQLDNSVAQTPTRHPLHNGLVQY